ncbi:MAG: RNA-binding protein [Planctomycetes bacterium]|nr:RNA-binding protein [Planctomycetota bacterium]
MANKTLFKSVFGKLLPKSDMVNEAGGQAYRFDATHALAQFAATGCLNSTFYASGDGQLTKVLELCEKLEPEFIARTALFARQKGFMKDMPALLCAALSVKGPGLMAEIFDRVIDNPKMLRNFVQIMRSGVVGRKSLGTLPKRLVLQWLESRSDEQIFFGSVGQDPSLADIVKMVHPKPATASRAALYGYLLGRECNAETLPEVVRTYEAFKQNPTEAGAVPDVPFQMLTSLELSREQWAGIARNASWQMTRMNLNAFLRHGVFELPDMAKLIADRLRSPELIAKARVFPYQLMVAYLSGSQRLPAEVHEALQDAMEIALANVPAVDGKVHVFPDVSGSMQSPVTGFRKGSTTAVRCIDVAALVAAAVLRKNPRTEVIPFECGVVRVRLNPRDSVMTNAQKLASVGGGGTNCSAPLQYLNKRRATGDLVIYVSDNESWVDSPRHGGFTVSSTETMRQWAEFKRRNPQARMVCIDIQPYDSTQAKEHKDIINVGGFSDQVFNLIADVAGGQADAGHWVKQIEAMVL